MYCRVTGEACEISAGQIRTELGETALTGIPYNSSFTTPPSNFRAVRRATKVQTYEKVAWKKAKVKQFLRLPHEICESILGIVLRPSRMKICLAIATFGGSWRKH